MRYETLTKCIAWGGVNIRRWAREGEAGDEDLVRSENNVALVGAANANEPAPLSSSKAAMTSASKAQEKGIEFKKSCFKFDWPVAWVAATGAVNRRRGYIVKVKAAMV